MTQRRKRTYEIFGIGLLNLGDDVMIGIWLLAILLSISLMKHKL